TDLVLLGLAAGIFLLPLAIGAAILRYRLFDLDYLISRTVVYGLLTVGAIAVYVGGVKGRGGRGGGGAPGAGSPRPGVGCSGGATGGCPATGTTRSERWPDSANGSGTLQRAGGARMCSLGSSRGGARPSGRHVHD